MASLISLLIKLMSLMLSIMFDSFFSTFLARFAKSPATFPRSLFVVLVSSFTYLVLEWSDLSNLCSRLLTFSFKLSRSFIFSSDNNCAFWSYLSAYTIVEKFLARTACSTWQLTWTLTLFSIATYPNLSIINILMELSSEIK